MSYWPKVRVTDKQTGHHYSAPQSAVDADPGRYRVLKSPALDAEGRPIPPKPATFPTVSAPAEAPKEPEPTPERVAG